MTYLLTYRQTWVGARDICVSKKVWFFVLSNNNRAAISVQVDWIRYEYLQAGRGIEYLYGAN